MSKKQLIYDYLSVHKDGVISTISPLGLPESAVVGYSETPMLELIFGTNISSRKARNIQKNPYVSFVVWSLDGITIQYEGKASILVGEELENLLNIHFAKIPEVKKYATDSGQTYFMIKPNWIRYTDCTVNPWKVIEVPFT